MKSLITPKQNRNAAMRILARSGASVTEKAMQDYQIRSDAQWLMAVEQVTGWGVKRLRRLYEARYRIRKEEKDFYESSGYDGVLDVSAFNYLKDRGIDMVKWFNECGEMIVESQVTNESFCKAKERALERVSEVNANHRINPRKPGDEFTVAKCCICHEWYEPSCELPHICRLQNSYQFKEC